MAAVEAKASSRVHDTIGDRGHVTVTSFNCVAPITGEIAFDADHIAVEQAVARVEGVRWTFNELAVMPASSAFTRSTDLVPVGKIRRPTCVSLSSRQFFLGSPRAAGGAPSPFPASRKSDGL